MSYVDRCRQYLDELADPADPDELEHLSQVKPTAEQSDADQVVIRQAHFNRFLELLSETDVFYSLPDGDPVRIKAIRDPHAYWLDTWYHDGCTYYIFAPIQYCNDELEGEGTPCCHKLHCSSYIPCDTVKELLTYPNWCHFTLDTEDITLILSSGRIN